MGSPTAALLLTNLESSQRSSKDGLSVFDILPVLVELADRSLHDGAIEATSGKERQILRVPFVSRILNGICVPHPLHEAKSLYIVPAHCG